MTDLKNGTRASVESLTSMDPVAVFAYFGKPPVLATEDLGAYNVLRDGLIVEVKPRDWFEYIHLRRYIDHGWEAMRYQRCAAAIINITYREALKTLVSEFTGDGFKGLTIDQMVEGWFGASDTRNQILESWRRYGLNEDTVVAQAMAIRSSELARLSDMRAKAEAQAVGHMREIRHHRQASESRTMALLNAPENSERMIAGQVAGASA